MCRNIFFIFLLLFSVSLSAKEGPAQKETFFDRYHRIITQKYHNFIRKIDTFLSDTVEIEEHKLDEIIYKNRLETVFSFQYKEHQLKPNLYLRGNILLPRTSERLELVFSKQTDTRLKNQTIDPSYERGINDEHVNVGLKYYFMKRKDFALYSKLGMRLNLSKFDLYAKVGARQYLYNSLFRTILSANLYHYVREDGFIATGGVDFVREMGERFTLEQDNRVVWREETDETTTEHILKLYHQLDNRNRLEYWVSLLTRDDEEWNFCSDTYTAAIKYHHKINKWLFYDIIPQLYRQREDHFRLERAITFNFGITFAR
ncbi:MAG: hypothetical protein B6D59_05060 [Campylobacteraceae bacterium 4484_4]|nr:MAG: hypothetical protein B6D59_05060 [Campylobacteraceae bacterium 4484_4]